MRGVICGASCLVIAQGLKVCGASMDGVLLVLTAITLYGISIKLARPLHFAL